MAVGRLAPVARQRLITNLGVVAPGALWHTYIGGTPSTPLATYSDEGLTTQNANPIVADAGGLFGPVYLTPGLSYKFLVTDALGGLLWDQDNIVTPDQATVPNGGTGLATLTAHGVLIGEGTAAITVTAPGTAGQVLTSNGAAADPTFQTSALDPGVNDFRLTLTTGVPVTTADVLAATTLYCTPFRGNRIALYDGALWNLRSSAELSIAIPATVSQVYDVFCFDNAGVPTLELLAWTNDTTRATALVRQDGVLCKTGVLTRRYLGSVRTTAVSGQTEDSNLNRYVWNYSNRLRRPEQRFETTTSWTYASTTIRQANGAAANQVNFLIGVSEDLVEGMLNATASSQDNVDGVAAFGLDSTTTFAADQLIGQSHLTTNATGNIIGRASLSSVYRGFPGIGKHSLMWNEMATSGSASFYAAGGAFTQGKLTSGMLVTVWG